MFDLGFSELLLIAVVALVVLGPERLPKVARSAGLWVGRIQNFISSVKDDLGNQAGMAEFKAARDSIEQTAQQLRQDVHRQIEGVRTEVEDIQQTVSELDAQPDLPAADDGTTEPVSGHLNRITAVSMPALHQVSLQHQARQRKRDSRPRPRVQPQLRVRRHASMR